MFFALWPPQPVQARLGELAREFERQCGGRALPVANIHLTLAFLGELRPAQVRAVGEIAAAIPFEPFRMVLDRLGWFRRKSLLWAGCREDAPALLRLAAQLGDGLRRCGFRIDARPFRTHLTLLRKARRFRRFELEAPVAWDVDEFCLVRSRLAAAGATYEIVNRWTGSGAGLARPPQTNLG
jgi:2'-5' RNA ligase